MNLSYSQIIVHLLIYCAFTSCQKSSKVLDNGAIDIERVLSQNKELSLEKLGGKIKATQLETTDECLLPSKSAIVHVSDNNIFIKGGNTLYRFDREGRFVNRIGSIGQGPMEYNLLQCVSFNDADSTVCIYGGANKFYLWKYNGDPIRTVNISTAGYFSLGFQIDSGFWAEERVQNGENVKINIARFDKDGNRTASHFLTTFDEKQATTYLPAPIVRQVSDSLYHYYSGYADSLFVINPYGITGKEEIYMGKYQIRGADLSDMNYRIEHSDILCELWDVLSNDRHTILLLRRGQKLCMAYIDKESGNCNVSCEISDPRKGGGFKLREKEEIRLWPEFERNGNMFSLLNAMDYDASEVGWLMSSTYNTTDIDQNPLFIEVSF